MTRSKYAVIAFVVLVAVGSAAFLLTRHHIAGRRFVSMTPLSAEQARSTCQRHSPCTTVMLSHPWYHLRIANRADYRGYLYCRFRAYDGSDRLLYRGWLPGQIPVGPYVTPGQIIERDAVLPLRLNEPHRYDVVCPPIDYHGQPPI